MSRHIEVAYEDKPAVKLTTRGKRVIAGLALTGVALTGAYAAGKIDHQIERSKEIATMVNHPEDLEQGTYIERQVVPGENATDIAAQYAVTQDHFEEIRDQIDNQADIHGALQQGQEVRISNAFIDEMPKSQP